MDKPIFPLKLPAFIPDNPTAHLTQLAALWMDKKVVAYDKDGYTVVVGSRLKRSLLVRIENDELANVDLGKPPTHIIVDCFGTIGDHALFLLLQPYPASWDNLKPTMLKVK